MRSLMKGVAVFLVALTGVACNGSPDPDSGPPPDSGVADSGTPDTGRPDIPVDMQPSSAGLPCSEEDPCTPDILTCDTSVTGGFCTAECTNSTSAANERGQCGGLGSTCLTIGDPGGANPPTSRCTHACSPSAATSGCANGRVCTGWFYTHEGQRPDTTGCWPMCSPTSCPTGQFCGRDMECGAAVNMMKKADGTACNPRAATNECRGICFSVDSAAPTRGICGSFVNTRDSRLCPDDPESVILMTPTTSAMASADNLALCIFRSCTCDRDCTGGTGYVCVTAPMQEQHLCSWPDTAMGETNTPCPITDAGTDSGPTDSGPTDTGVAPTDTGVAPTDTGTAPVDASVD